MRILMPGGTGFLGSAVSRHLSHTGHEVVRIGRSSEAELRVDISELDGRGVEKLINETGPDLVLNLAGAGLSVTNVEPMMLHAVNTAWPALLATCICGLAETRLVHLASSTETNYTPGHGFESAYSESKAAGTARVNQIRRNAPEKISVLTSHNIYGPRQPKCRLVRWLIDHAIAGLTVNLTYPDRVRDFVFIGDAIHAFTACLAHPRLAHGGEIGTGRGTTLRDLALCVFDQAGADTRLVADSEGPAQDPFSKAVASVDRVLVPTTVDVTQGVKMTIDRIRKDQL